MDPDPESLLLLNDDCIYHVLELLPLEDLCKISETCVRLQTLGAYQFHHDYPNHLASSELKIYEKNEKIMMSTNFDYERCFSQYVQTITVNKIDVPMNAKLAKFMQLKCGKNIKKLSLVHCYWDEYFGKDIKDILENVEIIKFDYNSMDLETRPNARNAKIAKNVKMISLHTILKHCQRLKHLQLVPSYSIKFSRKQYPSLETIEFISIDNWNSQHIWNGLERFFRSNQNAKRIICRFDRGFGVGMEHMLRWFIDIIESAHHIEELFFEFRGYFILCNLNWPMKNDFLAFWKNLIKLAKRKTFKRLELQFDFNVEVRKFIGCTQVQSFSNEPIKTSADIVHEAFRNVNLLQHNHGNIEKKNASKLAKELENLQELYFDSCGNDFKFEWNIIPFVRYAKKLKKIVVRAEFTVQRRKLLILPDMNTERTKLDKATKLVIYIDEKWIGDTVSLPENVSDGLVTIIPTKLTKINEMCVQNPLVGKMYKEI